MDDTLTPGQCFQGNIRRNCDLGVTESDGTIFSDVLANAIFSSRNFMKNNENSWKNNLTAQKPKFENRAKLHLQQKAPFAENHFENLLGFCLILLVGDSLFPGWLSCSDRSGIDCPLHETGCEYPLNS